jgi:hypothetical protein
VRHSDRILVYVLKQDVWFREEESHALCTHARDGVTAIEVPETVDDEHDSKLKLVIAIDGPAVANDVVFRGAVKSLLRCRV